MKKILTVFITLIIIISLTGCSNTEANKVPAAPQTPAASQTPSVSQTPAVSQTPVASQTPSVSQTPAVSPTSAASSTPVPSPASSFSEQNKSQIDSNKEVTTERKMNTMNVTIGSTTFTATLEDNETTKTIVGQLPLTLNMSELNGNEKYSNLSVNLHADTPSCPEMINAGDIMLYGNNYIVLFYKTFSTSYSYVKLGHIDDPTGLAKAVGSGNVQVTFSISK